jgi:pimeloyl-ACP methyl ester carboxylesterase
MQGNLKTISGVDAGYNVATTKAVTPINLIISADWALLSLDYPDVGRLDNLASRALDEKTIIGKSITERYYTLAAAYAYWMGCSQRRRQGPMTAQRYPDNCNGIMVIALAVNWGQLFTGLHWVHQVMHELDYFPRPCEVKAPMGAAVDAYDWARWYSRWRCRLPRVSSQPFCFGRAILRLQWHQHRFYRKRSQRDESRTERRRARPIESSNGMAIIHTLTST